MPPRHQVPAELRGRPFNPAREQHLITREQVRGRSYDRIMRGSYWAPGGELHHGWKVKAALTVLPPEAVVAGRSAMWFWGAKVADLGDPVEVILPPGRRARSRAEITVRRCVLTSREWTETSFGRVTTPLRTAFDVGRTGEPLVTVPLLDALVAATGISPEEIAAFNRSRPGARGCRRLATALPMVTGRAESLPESRLRVLLLQAGLPAPEANYEVVYEGMLIARVDLAWPDLKVAVEYDGEYHDAARQIAADRVRLNRLRTAGWTVLVVDRHQMRNPQHVVDQVSTVLRVAQR